MKVSEQTNVQMPLKTVVSLITLVSVGTWAYFGIIERLNNIETQGKLMLSDVEKNTEFRIKWPRGEMGSLPSDSQQDLLIEFMSSQLEHMQEEMESMMSNSVNIKRAQQDIERLLNDVEKLKDKLRESNGGN